MDDGLQKAMQDRMSKMRAQAHRGRYQGGTGTQLVRTEEGPKPTYVPGSMSTSEGLNQSSGDGGGGGGGGGLFGNNVPSQQGHNGTTTNFSHSSSSYNSSNGMVALAPGTQTVNGGRSNTTSQPNDKTEDEEGAERLRQKLAQMGISETVAPLQQCMVLLYFLSPKEEI